MARSGTRRRASRGRGRVVRRRSRLLVAALIVSATALAGGAGAVLAANADALVAMGVAVAGPAGREDSLAADPETVPPADAGVTEGADASALVPVSPLPAGGAASVADRADPAWVARVAQLTGIPQRALAVYAGVEITLAAEQPGCRLSWNTLAGIGDVESVHGTISGGALGDDGRAVPPIVGIPLDGNGVEALADTDGGALDGDTVWDRAVGPMQFIPSTWDFMAADGDGDGVADPNDLDDAALAAGRYLCAGERDLADPGSWIAAIASYNSALDYNHRVAGAADAYALSAAGA